MNNDLLEHRGYYGSVQFSNEDECLYGKIEFIDDLVLYDGESTSAIRQAFIEAVDSYLATCAERGVEPNTTCKGTFNVRVGTELHKQAAVLARRRQQSLNDLVKDSLISFLALESGAQQGPVADLQMTDFDQLLTERLAVSSAFTITKISEIWQAANNNLETAFLQDKLKVSWHEKTH